MGVCRKIIDLEIQRKLLQANSASAFSSERYPGLQCVHRWKDKGDKRVHMLEESQRQPKSDLFNNDPSAGSPTETLLRLLLPLNDQV